jgi:hypothetical protein
MKSPFKLGVAFVLPALALVAAMGAAQSPGPGVLTPATSVEVVPQGRPGSPAHERPETPGNPDQARIKALDQQIATLREQFKSQSDPLQAQVKSLREKFEADLKPLVDERHDLVERGKSPALRDLDADEASQLAALADREKAEVEKVHQDYAQQRATLKAAFDQKRRGLRGGTGK